LLILFVIIAVLLVIALALRQVSYSKHQAKAAKLETPLFVQQEGTGSPTILLLHGLVASGRYWEPITKELSQDHKVVVPDLLGFGRSPWPKTEYTAKEHIEALDQTLQKIEVSESVIVVGHSMGSLLALHYAAQNPKRVIGLVLISPPHLTSRKDAKKKLSKENTFESLMSVNPFVSWVVCHFHEVVGAAATPLFKFFAKNLPSEVAEDSALHTWRSFNSSFENVVLGADLPALIRNTKIQTAVLLGDQDAYTKKSEIESAAKLNSIPIHILPGNHNFLLRESSESLKIIRQFIISLKLEPKP
jgi:pimeloyl-ACP methyl ester carboxylesterase